MKTIDLVPIKMLTLLEKNPRKITKEQFHKLCKSLEEDPEFFSNRPCLVHKVEDKLIVYAGNQRVLAAKKIGWKEVPVLIDENLSDELIKNRIIKDNKHYGEFDFDLLANEWEIEDLLDAGFLPSELSVDDFHDLDSVEENSEEEENDCCDKCGQKLKKKK